MGSQQTLLEGMLNNTGFDVSFFLSQITFHRWCQQSAHTWQCPIPPPSHFWRDPEQSGTYGRHGSGTKQEALMNLMATRSLSRTYILPELILITRPRIKNKFFLQLKLPGLTKRQQERKKQGTRHESMNTLLGTHQCFQVIVVPQDNGNSLAVLVVQCVVLSLGF